VSAEAVAERAAEDARVYLAASAPVDEHLADQLLLPMALGSGGLFIARTVTPHLRSNAAVIERFTGRKVTILSTGGHMELRVS
jgi:RNA 3'-terminal phosphate cyclase (ATP)